MSGSFRGHLGHQTGISPSSSLRMMYVTLHPTGGPSAAPLSRHPQPPPAQESGARVTHRVLPLGQTEGKFLLELHVVVAVIGPHLPGESWKSKWISTSCHHSHHPLSSKDTGTSDGDTGLLVTHCWRDGLSTVHLHLESSWRFKWDRAGPLGSSGSQSGQGARSFQRCRAAVHPPPLSLRLAV